MNFLAASGFFLMKSDDSEAEPPNQGAMLLPSTYWEITPASSTRLVPFRRPMVPVGSSV
jgi:hypothetical protein